MGGGRSRGIALPAGGPQIALSRTDSIEALAGKKCAHPLRLIPLQLDFPAMNGTSAAEGFAGVARELFDFRRREVGRQSRNHNDGLPSTLRFLAPQYHPKPLVPRGACSRGRPRNLAWANRQGSERRHIQRREGGLERARGNGNWNFFAHGWDRKTIAPENPDRNFFLHPHKDVAQNTRPIYNRSRKPWQRKIPLKAKGSSWMSCPEQCSG